MPVVAYEYLPPGSTPFLTQVEFSVARNGAVTYVFLTL